MFLNSFKKRNVLGRSGWDGSMICGGIPNRDLDWTVPMINRWPRAETSIWTQQQATAGHRTFPSSPAVRRRACSPLISQLVSQPVSQSTAFCRLPSVTSRRRWGHGGRRRRPGLLREANAKVAAQASDPPSCSLSCWEGKLERF